MLQKSNLLRKSNLQGLARSFRYYIIGRRKSNIFLRFFKVTKSNAFLLFLSIQPRPKVEDIQVLQDWKGLARPTTRALRLKRFQSSLFKQKFETFQTISASKD